MDTVQICGLVCALLVMIVGLAGCVLPGLPGTPLILAAAIGHRLYFGSASVGPVVLVVLVLLTALSIGLDYLAGLYGAKRLGATWRGVTGAAIGVALGILGGPVGILVGPFLGATGMELAGGMSLKEASTAGLGATLGVLAGAVGKIACGFSMVGLFVLNLLLRT